MDNNYYNIWVLILDKTELKWHNENWIYVFSLLLFCKILFQLHFKR